MMKSHYKYRRIFKALAAFLSILSISSCSFDRDDSLFYLLNGEKKSVSDYRGNWLLINFWAEWCAPCIAEVPILNQLHENRTKLGLNVIAFSYDRDANQKLRAAKAKYGMLYPVVATDPQPKVPFSRPSKLPALYIISPLGELYGPIYGKQSTEEILLQIEHLKQAK